MTEKTAKTTSRPLSPHLQIFKWHIMMTVSILHRVTGVALAVGSVLLVAWICGAAYDASLYNCLSNFFATLLGRALLFGWSFAFYFHLCNGIRHLFWDVGQGFELKDAERTAYLVFATSAVLTAITWVPIFETGAGK